MKRLIITLLASFSIYCCQAIEVRYQNEICNVESADEIVLSENDNLFLAISFDNAPADITIPCDSVYDFVPTATTDCASGGATVTATDINFNTTQNCPVVLTYQRFYLAQSPCGDILTHVQNISVIDDVAPIVNNCPEDVFDVECEDLVPIAPVTFTDNCDNDLNISFSQLIVNEEGAQADSCLLINSAGLSASELWAFWFPDFPGDHGLDDQWVWTNAQIPSFVRMGDMAFITGQIESLTNPGYIFDVNMKVKDRLEWNQWSALLTTNSPPINRTFKDAPGFATMGGQTLFEDWDYYVIDPTQSFLTGQGVLAGSSLQLFHEPANLLYGFQVGQAATNKNPNFGMSAWYNYAGTLVINGVAEEVDGFGDINVDASCTNFPSSICDYDVTRTWTATDDCGNSSTCEQIIHVVDNIGPEFSSCPEDITVDCNNIPPVPVITATDGGCSNSSTITFNEQIITTGLVCPVLQTIFRIWTAEDACGNVTICSQTITVVDDEAPVITCPADVSLECGDATPDPTTSGEATATDNCSANVSIAFSDSAPNGTCPITITRTWTAMDDCGNISTCDQLLNFFDTVPPTFDDPLPEDFTIECDISVLPSPTIPASDNCDVDVLVTFLAMDLGGNACTNQVLWTWTATDDCGNSTEHSIVVTHEDTTAPVIDIEIQITASCDSIPLASDISATDNCATDVTVTLMDETFSGGCPGTISREYMAADTCGNTSVAFQLITLFDNVAPVLSGVPADTTVECDQVPLPANVTATDNCDSDVVAVLSETSTTGCPYQITRTWTAIDECDNVTSETQVITVVDATAPVILNPPTDVTIECGQPIPGYSPEWSDNCGTLTVTAISGVAIDGCTELQFATYTAEDECGNSTSVSRTVTIVDTTSPTIIAAVDETVECDEAIPAPDATVTDNCQLNPTWTVSEVIVTGNCPQNYTIERTYTADDGCGNTATDIQTITVQDTTAPTFDNPLPEDFSVECDISVLPSPTIPATDNCGDVTVTFGSTDLGGDSCFNQELWTWTATDECGNSASHSITVTHEDTTAPTIVAAANQTVECDEAIPAPDATVTDNCQLNPTWTVSEVIVTGNCPQNYTIERTYTANDGCGNTATDTQTITIQDTTAPANLNPPADITVECDQPIPGYIPEWSDNCGTITETAISGVAIDGCNELQFATYTATDECGNSTSVSRTVTIVDTTPPVIICPADLTLPCNSPPPLVDLTAVTATDNCEVPSITHVGDVFGGDACTSLITRTFMATDACGNTATCDQIITIPIDFTAPTIACPADATLPCNSPPPAVDLTAVTATDGCSTPTITHVGDAFGGDACTAIITRTYMATDACGNTATCEQTITIPIDFTAPTIECPADLTLPCNSPLPAADITSVTATDGCSSLVITHVGDTPGGDFCTSITTRTYMATDACGNTATCEQTITIPIDFTAPTIECPADLTLPCNSPLPAADTTSVTATDGCSSLVITHVGDTPGGDFCTSITTRTYMATDACGNTATCEQTITIPIDFTAPTIECPADLTLPCNSPLPAADITSVTATDGCSSLVITHVGDTPGGDFCTSITTRTYMATDACGNTATCEQTITIPIDFTAPTIECPADLTLPCNSPLPAADTTSVTATDGCSSLVITHVGDTPGGDFCTSITTRTYMATDACGNTATCEQTITIPIDFTAPVIECPADITLPCNSPPPPVDLSLVSATDGCSTPVITHLGDSFGGPGSGPCTAVIVRTFQAEDACGNTATCEQIVTIPIDMNAPVITVVENITVECGDQIPPPNATVEDGCSDAQWTVTETFVDGCGNTGIYTRIYSATDDCGNTGTATQTITIVDTTPPFVEANPDMTIECGDPIPGAGYNAFDTCGDISVVLSMSTPPGCGDTKMIIRTFIVTDECGNVATDQQIITIVDTTPPTIIPANDETIECGDPIPVPDATATDTCGDATWTVDETFVGDCGNTGIYTRIYTATDECGNMASATQTITIVDTTAPTISAAADLTIECIDIIPNPSATVSDSCGDATWSFVESFVDDCGYTGVYTRVYTATDACGNTASATQTITVVDTTAPTIVPAADAIIECGDALPLADAIATDSCGDATWSVEADITATCGETFIMIRTYTATDECGNTASATQTITVVDTTPPSIVAGQDTVVECTDPIPAPSAIATDTCGDATWTVDETFVGDCGDTGVYTRVYTATDECGNSASATQIVTVVDSTPPTLIPDADETIECGDSIPAPDATATDTCGDATWTVDETFIGDCGNTGIYTRIYTATDECGNTASATQTITVVDTTAPTIVPAADATIECGDALPPADAVANDTCGDATWTVSAVITETCGETFVMVRTYVATDDCGNTASAEQIITVLDTTPPSLTVADDLTLECNEIVPGPDASATDTCGNATWSVVESTTPGACPQEYTLVRTYTAIDDCDNMTIDTQTIVVIDSTEPVLSDLPSDMIVSCDAIPVPVVLTATDNCDPDVPVTYSEIVGTGCNYSIFRTWTATDDCGNSTSHTQEIMTIDDEAPSIIVPDDQTLECDEVVPSPFYIVNDNCDNDPLVEIIELIIPGDCPQEYILERTYTATDICGNSSSAIETIFVIDTTAPIIMQPIPVSVQKECTDLGIDVMDLYDYLEGDLNDTDSLWVEQAVLDLFESCGLVPDATDNCGDVTITPISILIAGFNSLKFPETGFFEIVWQASDECGNISTETKTTSIQVVDNTHPQALCQDITVELGQDGYVILDPNLIDNGSSDNCGPVFLSLAEDSLTCEDVGVNLATLLVFDLGGNLSTCTATVTLVNNNPSGLLCPDDLNIGTDKDQCVAFIATSLLFARPSDPCENMEIMHVVTYADGSTSTGGDDASGMYPIGTHVIIWTAQGEDGTIHTCSTTVTVTDDQEPSPLCLNITASLNNFEVTVPATSLNALSTDNCVGELTFTINGQPSISYTCDDLGLNTVYLEVTDEAGNVGVCEASVDVQDPLGNCVPEPCDAPTDLAHTINANNVLLTWTPPAGAEACQITGGVVGGDQVSIIKYAPNIYQHYVPNNLLIANADYQWRVRCACELDPLDVSPFSPYNYFNMSNPLVNEEIYELEAMEVIDNHKILSFDGNSIGLYPNPNNGEFFIETSLLDYNVEIYDLNGKIVYSENNINTQLYTIELKTVERGFYFVRLFDDFGFDERMKVIIE